MIEDFPKGDVLDPDFDPRKKNVDSSPGSIVDIKPDIELVRRDGIRVVGCLIPENTPKAVTEFLFNAGVNNWKFKREPLILGGDILAVMHKPISSEEESDYLGINIPDLREQYNWNQGKRFTHYRTEQLGSSIAIDGHTFSEDDPDTVLQFLTYAEATNRKIEYLQRVGSRICIVSTHDNIPAHAKTADTASFDEKFIKKVTWIDGSLRSEQGGMQVMSCTISLDDSESAADKYLEIMTYGKVAAWNVRHNLPTTNNLSLVFEKAT